MYLNPVKLNCKDYVGLTWCGSPYWEGDNVQFVIQIATKLNSWAPEVLYISLYIRRADLGKLNLIQMSSAEGWWSVFVDVPDLCIYFCPTLKRGSTLLLLLLLLLCHTQATTTRF